MNNAQFIDPNGNPLPAGVRVQVFTGSNTLGTLTLDQYFGVGATTVGLLLSQSTQYTASFIGLQAPTGSVTFTTPSISGTTQVTVTGYLSPDLTQTNLAVTQANLWPRGWFSDAAKSSGGNAYNLAYAAAWILAQIDVQHQTVTTTMRLQSSIGQDIDSWAYDYFGNTLPRNSNETDTAYIARIEANLAAKKGTRSGVLAMAGFYGTAFIDEPFMTVETGAWDVNGVFAWDSIGGWGAQIPFLSVFVTLNGGASASQLKSTVMASRPIGVATQVYSVSGNVGTLL